MSEMQVEMVGKQTSLVAVVVESLVSSRASSTEVFANLNCRVIQQQDYYNAVEPFAVRQV